MTIVPIMTFLVLTISYSYIVSLKLSQFEYTLNRYEKSVRQKNDNDSCINLMNLYKSYDSMYVITC
jgi:hypothetical protein